VAGRKGKIAEEGRLRGGRVVERKNKKTSPGFHNGSKKGNKTGGTSLRIHIVGQRSLGRKEGGKIKSIGQHNDRLRRREQQIDKQGKGERGESIGTLRGKFYLANPMVGDIATLKEV